MPVVLPDLVETETTPAPRPNSAEKVPVSTLNSRTDSTVGCTITVLKVYSLLSMPSTSQAFVLACEPRALKLEAPRGLKVEAPERFSPTWPGVTPGTRYTSGGEVAPVQGQLAHRALLDHLAQLGGVGAGERRQPDHLGRLGEAAHLQGRVHARALVHLQHDAAVGVLPEAGELDRHVVGARDQEGRHERAVGVGRVGAHRPLVHLGDGHAWRPGTAAPCSSLTDPDDGAGRDLGLARRPRQQSRQRERDGGSAGDVPLHGHNSSLSTLEIECPAAPRPNHRAIGTISPTNGLNGPKNTQIGGRVNSEKRAAAIVRAHRGRLIPTA